MVIGTVSLVKNSVTLNKMQIEKIMKNNWTTKYWDTIDQLYWDPIYLGLKSIPKKLWRVTENEVILPKDSINLKSGLYTRQRKIGEQIDFLHRQEETLNHIFDITCSILPDKAIHELFLKSLNILDFGPFQSLGREVRYRYGWGEHANVTQQDGLFISDNSYCCIEIKLNAKSSPGQIAKYLSLMVWEYITHGPKENFGLLYIVPEKKKPLLWKECGLENSEINNNFMKNQDLSKMSKFIKNLYDQHPGVYSEILNKLKLNVISWSDLVIALDKMAGNLDQENAGDQTLYRLAMGLRSQIYEHEFTGVSD